MKTLLIHFNRKECISLISIFSACFNKLSSVLSKLGQTKIIKTIIEKKEGEFNIIKTVHTFIFTTLTASLFLPYLYTPQLIIGLLCTVIDTYLRWRYKAWKDMYYKVFPKVFIICVGVTDFTTAIVIRIILLVYDFIRSTIRKKQKSYSGEQAVSI